MCCILHIHTADAAANCAPTTCKALFPIPAHTPCAGDDADELEDALLGGGGGRADNPLGVDLLNLQLGLIHRDFTEDDYEVGI